TAISLKADGSEPERLWNESNQRPGTASPLVIGDKLYLLNNAGVLAAANKDTGERIWRIRLKGPSSGSPVAGANGFLYIFSEAGIGQVVDLSGDEGTVVSELELGETILCTPSLGEGAIFVRSDGHLWKLGQ
ncbi:MAG: PQQ-binding-like beta-propeller repeat protein, partial [Verrucomicrobiota bacterium]